MEKKKRSDASSQDFVKCFDFAKSSHNAPKSSLDAAKSSLDFSKSFHDAAKSSLDAAKSSLDFAKSSLDAIKKITQEVRLSEHCRMLRSMLPHVSCIFFI